MSFSIEKIITIGLYCHKCDKDLIPLSRDDQGEMWFGVRLYQCPICKYIIRVGEKE